MKLLLTGASGFVGAAVAQRTRAEARHVLIDTAQRRLASDWSSALAGCDAVLHLAARAHVMREQASDPLATYRATNTAGTLHLARQAAAAGVRRFVFVSTVKVHGEHTLSGRPFVESMEPDPQDPYAVSKHEAELGLRQIAEQTGMEIVIVRPPLVYGPGVKANFAALVRAVLRGWPLPLGAIDNRRSLVALDNLVDCLLLCLTHPAAAQQTFLVSDGDDLSTTDLLRRLGVAANRPAHLLPVPPALLQAGAGLLGRGAAAGRLCDNLQVDITKARTLLGWTPPISVDEGLRRAARGWRP